MTISNNIQSLSYFNIDNGGDRVNITLDISNEYPNKLSAFTVECHNYNNRINEYSGIITGPEDRVELLK